ncbi:MAG: ATP-binding protein [Pseudomonadota bacterium]
MTYTVQKTANYTQIVLWSQPARSDVLPLTATHLALYNARVAHRSEALVPTYSPSVANLRNLLLIRGIALLGQGAVLVYVLAQGTAPADLTAVMLCLALLAVLTVISLWRTTRPWPVEDREFLIQLLIDLLGWTGLMYFTGGANNPFISYYIVPLVVAAAVLPWRFTWLIAGACLLAYSVLLFVYRPFPLFTPHGGMHHEQAANAHILGMWFNFLFSVGLITYFVVRMAATLRQHDSASAARREERLRNDQVLAVASLAAGTAHELGTPLATMRVLIDELQATGDLNEEAKRDCALLSTQIDACKNTLSKLSRTAELASNTQMRTQTLAGFVEGVLAQWAVRRPGTPYELNCPAESPSIETDTTLGQALENLLHNAADTGSARINVEVGWQTNEACIAVRDWGQGIAHENMENLGKPFLHADAQGLGIGLLLSQAAVERHGGRIELRNHPKGGAVASLYLPLSPTDPEAGQ